MSEPLPRTDARGVAPRARGRDDAGRLRLGIAGTGFIGQMHARNAARSGSVELVAVASARDAQKAAPLAQELGDGVRALSLEQLYGDEEVEAVLLATRTTDHLEHALRVLAAGKHLLLEKPGAVTLADQSRISEAAAARPELCVRVAYHRRHDPRYRELSRLISEGAIGEPFAVHSITREDYPPGDGDRFSGGFILDVGVHDFDTARWLLGADPSTVFARGHSPVYADDGPDNVYVTIAYDRAVTTVQLSRTSRAGLETRFEVVGSEGAVLLAPAQLGGGITITTAARAREFPVDCRAAFPDAYPAELTDFAHACRGATVIGADLDDDRWAVATAIAARASASRGQPLTVGTDWD
jgi:predicted dehydrogenase